MKQALMRSTVADSSLDDRARAMWRQVKDMQLELSGSEMRDTAGAPGPVSIQTRLSTA